MAKGPTYGEFSFPKSDVTFVRGYARGGRVEKTKFSDGGTVAPAKPNIPKPKDSLTPPPRPADSAPKKLLGEQMGWPKKNEIGKQTYARGGMVHADAKQDKAMIKKAVGMHDTQLHKGKHTNLAKLKSGGRVYAHGGMVEPMAAKAPKSVSKPSKAKPKPKQAMGALGQIAAPAGGPMLKAGGMIGKQAKLKPSANVNAPPKSINVKSRMSAGVGSVENLKCGGFIKSKKG